MQVGIGMEADGSDVVGRLHRPAVQGLDVGQLVREAHPAGGDPAGGQPVEHEGVVGVGAVSEGEFLHG